MTLTSKRCLPGQILVGEGTTLQYAPENAVFLKRLHRRWFCLPDPMAYTFSREAAGLVEGAPHPRVSLVFFLATLLGAPFQLTYAFLRCGHTSPQGWGPPAEPCEPMTTPTPPPPQQNLTHRFKSVAFSHDYHPRIFQCRGFSSRLTNVRFMNPNRARFWADLCVSLSDLSTYEYRPKKLRKR
jgi:hypothetical protein